MKLKKPLFGYNVLPVKFRDVVGNFNCGLNVLSSLKGCPSSVGGNFYCGGNNLLNLVGGPISVGGDYFCASNKLVSLVCYYV